jgi:hypothetical protein
MPCPCSKRTNFVDSFEQYFDSPNGVAEYGDPFECYHDARQRRTGRASCRPIRGPNKRFPHDWMVDDQDYGRCDHIHPQRFQSRIPTSYDESYIPCFGRHYTINPNDDLESFGPMRGGGGDTPPVRHPVTGAGDGHGASSSIENWQTVVRKSVIDLGKQHKRMDGRLAVLENASPGHRLNLLEKQVDFLKAKINKQNDLFEWFFRKLDSQDVHGDQPESESEGPASSQKEQCRKGRGNHGENSLKTETYSNQPNTHSERLWASSPPGRQDHWFRPEHDLPTNPSNPTAVPNRPFRADFTNEAQEDTEYPPLPQSLPARRGASTYPGQGVPTAPPGRPVNRTEREVNEAVFHDAVENTDTDFTDAYEPKRNGKGKEPYRGPYMADV